ncbi:hypothetical protein C8J56DRAFT_963387, partial [Mycena floridula]
MPPRSGAKSSIKSKEPILVHDSDSEPEFTTRKRQKTSNNSTMTSTTDGLASTSCLKDKTKNAALKGRRRFNADLEDLKNEVKAGLVVYDLQIKRVAGGDDEGTVETVITKVDGTHVLAVNLLTSDTSDYPKNHSFFSYSPDAKLDAKIQDVVDEIPSAPSATIGGALLAICSALTRAMGGAVAHQQESQSQEIEMDDESDEDYEPYDAYETVASSSHSKAKLSKMQLDFVDTVGTGYRPGIIRFGGDDFCLTVSVPVVSLADSIPPRALVAWDRRLLSKFQHLTLLISGLRGIYPLLKPDGTLVSAAQSSGVQLSFKVGLSGQYKPSKENAQEACRNFGLIGEDAEDILRQQAEKAAAEQAMFDDPDASGIIEDVPEEDDDEGRFDRFSLSGSLESLLNQVFLKVVHIRRTYGLGWAGAELVYSLMEKHQQSSEAILNNYKVAAIKADKDEQALTANNVLPHDPLRGLPKSTDINLPLTAFCYLVRRLTLCNRFCIVCHNKIITEFEVLKPYVCDSKLCQYQYYSLNRGPSLEYEIMHNPLTVDLLISMAYSAAAEGVMDDPLPIGLGLRVPLPGTAIATPAFDRGGAAPTPDEIKAPHIAADGLCEFDELGRGQMRSAIAAMINSLPAIDDMRKHLSRKVKPGKSKPKLKDMDPAVLPAAWSIARWCVGSCTAYLEEITGAEDSVKNLDPAWRQYRFSVGAPDVEDKFAKAVAQAVASDANAQKYPSLYAFHGSPLRNWHSIIRHGLWFKTIANGRAYGNGVYLAKDASVSMGHYAHGNRVSAWNKSKVSPSSCVALAEIVNLPSKFVSSNPYFVIPETSWIVCRYLLVRGAMVDNPDPGSTSALVEKKSKKGQPPMVKLDPAHPTTLSGKVIDIPVSGYELDSLLEARRFEAHETEADSDDRTVFDHVEPPVEVIELEDSDDEMYDMTGFASSSKSKAVVPTKSKARPKDDWQHIPKWVEDNTENLFPPPVEATNGATAAVQRELKAMMKEMETCSSYKDLGWFMNPVGDNFFQWIVEMHSFDPTIPIAKDLADKKVNSIIFEIRFPPNYPNSPPFFRIVTPRFLPFIHGGGGHITGGGSICMDLLTTNGWLPSYSIPAVLLQIKLAISNLDPRPARLAQNWNHNYTVFEALEGFKRAAATHGWTVPAGLEKLI